MFMQVSKLTTSKRLFISFVLTILSNSIYSQLTKGNWLVGGTGKFYDYKSEYSSATYSNEAEYTQIDISPNIGYFVAEKLAFGLRPTFSSVKGKVTTVGGGSTNVQRYWIGPFGRYYFLAAEKQANIVTDVSYQFGFYGGLLKGRLSTFSALVGPVIYFNSSVGLEFLLGYAYSKEDADQGSKEIRKGFQISLGFQIHLEQ
jgi:hypothetical protein